MQPGEGLCTDMRAVRKDYFLDHDHSAYVDQWDWERVITAQAAQSRLPQGNCPEDLERDCGCGVVCAGVAPQAEGLAVSEPAGTDHVSACGGDPRSVSEPAAQQRETEILQRYPAVFIIGIGWMLKGGYPHELRAADYDDWVTPTLPKNGHLMHGLNGDILVWNPVTRRRHELSSMGIRVNAESLKGQPELTHQLDFTGVSVPPGDREA